MTTKKEAPLASKPKTRAGKLRTKPADTENWDGMLGFLMHDVSRLRRSVFDEFMKPMAMTRSQWWILAHLSRHDGMTQSDLANVLDIGKAALGGLIDRFHSTHASSFAALVRLRLPSASASSSAMSSRGVSSASTW